MSNLGKWFWPTVILVAVCLASFLAPPAVAQQEQVLVGRISNIEGQLLRYVPESKDWVAVVKDAPFGLNDALYSDSSTKAEFIMPNGLWVRIAGSTQIQLIALKPEASEIDVASGVARFYNKNSNGMLKVTTPFGYVLAEPGSTVDVYVGDQSVEAIALDGQVDYFQQSSNARYEAVPGGPSVLADATQVASGEGQVDTAWDDWNAARDSIWTKRVAGRGEAVKYLPPQLQDDAYDLEESGTWERVNYEGEYHEFWRPTAVAASWQPFTVGRWTDYYGDQVWVPDESFGYVTHHYGNWVIVNGRWYWAPPAPVVQVAAGPVIGFGWYPGRVAWISTDADVGWVPLAPTEVYYSNHHWGPSAVVVTTIPAATIAIGSLAFASAAIVVPQTSFYSVSNYSSVRVTNINHTTIVNNFHTAPVVNNTVIKNYNQTTAKYNFVNKAPEVKPHAIVAERIAHNDRLAGTEAKSLTPQGLKQATTSTQLTKPLGKAAVPPPTKLTNKLVPLDQVNAPKGQALFKQTEIMKSTKPATASPAAKAGGPGTGRTTTTTQPPAPGVTQPPAPGGGRTTTTTQPPTPGVTQPPAPGTGRTTTTTQPPAPGVTRPPAPGVTQPPAPGVTRPPTPGVTQPPAPGVTQPPAPGVTQPPAPGTGRTTTTTQPPAVTHQPPPAVTHQPPPATGGGRTTTTTQPPAVTHQPPPAVTHQPPPATGGGRTTTTTQPPAVTHQPPPAPKQQSDTKKQPDNKKQPVQ
jgi:hypothetical protein